MNVSVIGISHHTAAVADREAFALPGDLAGRLLQAIKVDGAFEEALVLDTCNRTEVYFVTKDCADPMGHLLALIADVTGVPPIADSSALYHHQGKRAVEHLFRVAAAVDSQIVGEHQILGQVKNAYRLACDQRSAKFLMNKLLHTAFRVGKRVQTETDLGQGSTSVAQAAVTLALQVFSNLSGKSVMLVGAGDTGALAAKALVRCGVGRVVVANRTVEKAQQVAQEVVQFSLKDAELLDLDDQTITCPALRQMLHALETDGSGHPAPDTQAIGLNELPSAIGQVDLVISATGSPDLVLTHENLAKAIRRSGRSLLLVDIAVPRDIDPKLDKLGNVFLYNMDDLDRIVDQNVEVRRAEIPRVEAIIAAELDDFTRWHDSLQITPTIKLLQQRFNRTQADELKRAAPKLGGVDADQLQQFSRGLCNKILHEPMAFLRQLAEEASPSEMLVAAEMLRRMFKLDELEEDDQ